MVGATGIEPVTPTMSTYQVIDFTHENTAASGFDFTERLVIVGVGSKNHSAKTLQNPQFSSSRTETNNPVKMRH